MFADVAALSRKLLTTGAPVTELTTDRHTLLANHRSVATTVTLGPWETRAAPKQTAAS